MRHCKRACIQQLSISVQEAVIFLFLIIDADVFEISTLMTLSLSSLPSFL